MFPAREWAGTWLIPPVLRAGVGPGTAPELARPSSGRADQEVTRTGGPAWPAGRRRRRVRQGTRGGGEAARSRFTAGKLGTERLSTCPRPCGQGGAELPLHSGDLKTSRFYAETKSLCVGTGPGSQLSSALTVVTPRSARKGRGRGVYHAHHSRPHCNCQPQLPATVSPGPASRLAGRESGLERIRAAGKTARQQTRGKREGFL